MQVERTIEFYFIVSGKRVSNTLVTYPKDRDNFEKSRLIPDKLEKLIFFSKAFALWDGLMAYQLVGRVKAYQGYDE